jgi:hypothetical protein
MRILIEILFVCLIYGAVLKELILTCCVLYVLASVRQFKTLYTTFISRRMHVKCVCGFMGGKHSDVFLITIMCRLFFCFAPRCRRRRQALKSGFDVPFIVFLLALCVVAAAAA